MNKKYKKVLLEVELYDLKCMIKNYTGSIENYKKLGKKIDRITKKLEEMKKWAYIIILMIY